MILGRDDILGADDLSTRRVACPEWGGTVIVREMTGTQREAFEQAVVSTNGDDTSANTTNLRAWLASFTMVDEAGELLFSADDVRALGDKSATALIRVCNEAQNLNGIGADEVEELVEDFGDGPSGSSSTD